jgi:hypothetical protein
MTQSTQGVVESDLAQSSTNSAAATYSREIYFGLKIETAR